MPTADTTVTLTEEKRLEMRETARGMLKDWDRLSTAKLRDLGAEAERERRYEAAAALFEEAAKRYPKTAGQLAQRDIEALRSRAAECRKAAEGGAPGAFTCCRSCLYTGPNSRFNAGCPECGEAA